MKQDGSPYWRPLLATAMLCLAACIAGCAQGADNPKEARAGGWQGETEFGSFAFTVCEGGGKITDYTLEYTTGGTTQALALGGGDEISIDRDGAFDLSTPDAGVVFTGQFSADGRSASGAWEITAPGGETLSEDWAIDR